MGHAMDRFHTFDLVLFAAGTFAAAFVTGLAGLAFGIVAAAVWLHFLAPAQATALIVVFGLIVQGFSHAPITSAEAAAANQRRPTAPPVDRAEPPRQAQRRTQSPPPRRRRDR
jgi:hypothetical protein